MSRKLTFSMFSIIVFLVGTLVISAEVQRVGASETIYIRADGSIDPPTANITSADNITYTFTDNNYDAIVVERSDIVIDGNGFTLQGAGVWMSKGLRLVNVSNVTVHNATVTNFTYGVYLNFSLSSVLLGNNITGTQAQGILLRDSTNNTITGNWVARTTEGVRLESSPNNTIIDNMITNNEYTGVILISSSNNLISGNEIVGNHAISSMAYGIYTSTSSGNKIYGNNVTDNDAGIRSRRCNDTIIIGNNVTANIGKGIEISDSTNVTIRDNRMEGNRYGFGVEGEELSHYLHSIDTSNLVDGKPVYYLLNQQSGAITPSTFPEIGYLALVNSTAVIVDGLKLTKNLHGLLIAYTNHTQVRNCNLTRNNFGVFLYHSFNNTLSKNRLSYNDDSISLWGSASNRLLENTIAFSDQYAIEFYDVSQDNRILRNHLTSNSWGIYLCGFSHGNLIQGNVVENTSNSGIYLEECQNNIIRENTVTDSGAGGGYGVELDYGSSNNVIYHNNFINNSEQAYAYELLNQWDNGLEGNYWSHYSGWDADHDGIGDLPLVVEVNKTDYHPLMGMFSSFNTSLRDHVYLVSNSTVESLQYFEENSTITMYASNMTMNQTHGFCRVCIPHNLINASESPIEVIINEGLTTVLNFNNTLYDNGTHRWIYFAYEHTTHTIDIIPELSSLIMLSLFMIVSVLVVTIHKGLKRKQLEQKL